MHWSLSILILYVVIPTELELDLEELHVYINTNDIHFQVCLQLQAAARLIGITNSRVGGSDKYFISKKA